MLRAVMSSWHAVGSVSLRPTRRGLGKHPCAGQSRVVQTVGGALQWPRRRAVQCSALRVHGHSMDPWCSDNEAHARKGVSLRRTVAASGTSTWAVAVERPHSACPAGQAQGHRLLASQCYIVVERRSRPSPLLMHTFTHTPCRPVMS